jgi:hypothetical protein
VAVMDWAPTLLALRSKKREIDAEAATLQTLTHTVSEQLHRLQLEERVLLRLLEGQGTDAAHLLPRGDHLLGAAPEPPAVTAAASSSLQIENDTLAAAVPACGAHAALARPVGYASAHKRGADDTNARYGTAFVGSGGEGSLLDEMHEGELPDDYGYAVSSPSTSAGLALARQASRPDEPLSAVEGTAEAAWTSTARAASDYGGGGAGGGHYGVSSDSDDDCLEEGEDEVAQAARLRDLLLRELHCSDRAR